MVWKTGKFGVNNGRTVRSTRTPGKRSEGLLIQTTASSEDSRDQGELETIAFSLGKQNRWLLPEVIKENSIEVEKDDFVLVESYTNHKRDRKDCFSVYNSKSRTTRKSKGKFAQANDLLSGIEEMKTRYEVSYPHPSGSWQHEKQCTRRQTKHLGARKKNSFANWNFDMELEEVNETDLLCHEIDEDFDESLYSSNSDRSVTLDLRLLLKNSTQKKKNCSAKTKTSWQIKVAEESKELPLRKGECIYIESGNDMYNAHHELLAQMLYDSEFDGEEDWAGGSLWYSQGRGGQSGGRGRGAWRGRGRGSGRGGGRGRGSVHHYVPNETLPSADSETSEPSEFTDEDSCEQFAFVDLSHAETNPTLLKERWGEKYTEAASLP